MTVAWVLRSLRFAGESSIEFPFGGRLGLKDAEVHCQRLLSAQAGCAHAMGYYQVPVLNITNRPLLDGIHYPQQERSKSREQGIEFF